MIYTEEQIQGYLDLIKTTKDAEYGYGYGYIGPSGGGGPGAFHKGEKSEEPEVETDSSDVESDEDLAEIFRELEDDYFIPLFDPVLCCGTL